MESREKAIAFLVDRGFHAQEWDCYAPGAIAIASEVVDAGGFNLLKHMVLLVPDTGGWSLRSDFPVDASVVSLAEAISRAEQLVTELKQFGVPKAFLRNPSPK